MSKVGADFIGAFGILRDGDRLLMVQNQRVIGGRDVLTWDLPGGQVEHGESLAEALARELAEEVAIDVRGASPFLFYQEGERVVGGARQSLWRSFFFEVQEFTGTPRASGEVLALRWMAPTELRRELTAPYHDSFVQWLERGGRAFHSVWRD